jgi:hypothetical protein
MHSHVQINRGSLPMRYRAIRNRYSMVDRFPRLTRTLGNAFLHPFCQRFEVGNAIKHDQFLL